MKGHVSQHQSPQQNQPLWFPRTINSNAICSSRFAHVSSEATRREAELQRLARAWEEFEVKRRTVEEWASRAEALLADTRLDNKQAVDFHKRFFQGADERAVAELVRSGRELIEVSLQQCYKWICTRVYVIRVYFMGSVYSTFFLLKLRRICQSNFETKQSLEILTKASYFSL